MKTLIARYKSTCFECGEPIIPGQMIHYYGRLHSAHADCEDQIQHHDKDQAAGLEQGTLENDRRLAKRGISVTRFSSGIVATVNSRGRCEDAPCCGCCT